MAGNDSAGKIKGNDALSLPDPQTKRKPLLTETSSNCKAGDKQSNYELPQQITCNLLSPGKKVQ